MTSRFRKGNLTINGSALCKTLHKPDRIWSHFYSSPPNWCCRKDKEQFFILGQNSQETRAIKQFNCDMFNNINSNYFWWLSFLPLKKSISHFYSCQLLCIWYPDTFFIFFSLPPSTPTKKCYRWESYCCQDEDSCGSAAAIVYWYWKCCTLVAYFLFWFIPRELLIYFFVAFMERQK